MPSSFSISSSNILEGLQFVKVWTNLIRKLNIYKIFNTIFTKNKNINKNKMNVGIILKNMTTNT